MTSVDNFVGKRYTSIPSTLQWSPERIILIPFSLLQSRKKRNVVEEIRVCSSESEGTEFNHNHTCPKIRKRV